MSNPEPKPLNMPPFKAFLASNIPSVYDNTLSYYDELTKLIAYLEQQVVPTVNANTEGLKQLKDFVEHYFDNLNVQTEINNKLDDMAISGELAQIVIDHLNDMYIYQEITTTEYFNQAKNTKYWITHIPHEDSDGNLIALKHGLADDVDDENLAATETTRSFAKRAGTTVCVNASVFQNTNPDLPNYMHPIGPIIKDGTLVCNYEKGTAFADTPNYILGVKEDNTLACYDFETTPAELLEDGVINSFVAFDQLIDNGVITSDYSSTYNYVWNIIGQDSITKDIYLFECEGKDIFGAEGMSIPEACTILKNLGCDFAYRLDQGGSTSICKNAVQLNQPTDDYGTSERKVVDYIYFAKPYQTDFDRIMATANGEASDANMLAMKNKATTYYLQDVDNNLLIFNKGIVKNSNLQGLHIRYAESGTPKCSIVLDGAGRSKQLSIYDIENSKTLAYIDGVGQTFGLGADTDTNKLRITSNNTNNYTSIQGVDRGLLFKANEISLYDYDSGTTTIKLDALNKNITLGGSKTAQIFENISQVAATADFDTLTTTGFYFVNYTADTGSNRPFEKPCYLMVMSPYSGASMQVAFAASGDTSIKPKYRLCISNTWTDWLTLA